LFLLINTVFVDKNFGVIGYFLIASVWQSLILVFILFVLIRYRTTNNKPERKIRQDGEKYDIPVVEGDTHKKP
jgi:hypothetical protein